VSETRGSADTKIAMMRAAYEAWPDLDTYLREFRDDAVWHSPFAGDVSGKQAIRAYLSQGLLSVEEWIFAIHDIVGNEEHTVVLGRNDVRFANGQILRGLLSAEVFHWMMRVWPGMCGHFRHGPLAQSPCRDWLSPPDDKAFDTSCRLSFSAAAWQRSCPMGRGATHHAHIDRIRDLLVSAARLMLWRRARCRGPAASSGP